MEEPISGEAIADYFIVSDPIEESSVPAKEKDEDPKHADPSDTQVEPPASEVVQDEADITMSEVDKEIVQVSESEAPSELPQPAITKVLSATQIEEMFESNENQGENHVDIDEQPSNEIIEDEQLNVRPDVVLDDMKAVQEELREMDILVCGSCHTVTHFLEEFKLHKPSCKRKSDFHGNIAETKPQVWAFLLWKNAQSKMKKTFIEESSWKLYQKWCKMPDRIRNAWVAAGETVMNFSTFGFAKINDSLIKPLNTKKSDKDPEEVEEKPIVLRKLVQRDAAGEIKEIKPSPGIRKRINDDIEHIRSQLEDGDSSQDKEISTTTGPTDSESPRVGFTKVHRVKGKDGEEDTLQEEEFVVEKIVSRRFNPRKKQYEYLLKWEGYPSEQNTWEPAENLEACQHLLKAFEENLAKQSLNKQKAAGYKQKVDNVAPSSPSYSNYGGRPIRYSKQKALSQVKQWCGSIKPDDAELELLKRKMPITDSDEEDDPYAKKVRLERDSDGDEYGSKMLYSKGPKSGIVRRPGRPPLKPKITNGTTESLAAVLGLETSNDDGKHSTFDAINRGIVKKSSGMSVHNQQVLVANAKGVVKVDPSQVPNLSSGVYIMSNKSGIIKLDSVSPSKVLSMKGVPQQPTVKQFQVPAPPPPAPSSGGVTSTSQSGIIMVNRENQSKTGIVRRPGVTPRGRGVGRPPSRPNPSVRAPNPNTRLIHSGSRSNISVTPGVRPRTPLKSAVNDFQRKPMEGDKRILGPKVGGRGGLGRGAMRGSRGGGTGKVLLKAEGEKTPDPTPPQSPKQNALETAVSEMMNIKEEMPGSPLSGQTYLKVNSGKDPLVKKTLKPGSIGSMSVSPKKTFTDDNDSDTVTITGDDGLVYKVKKSELNSTLVVSGEDGQQYVVSTGDGDEAGTVLTLDPSYAETVAQLGHVNILDGDGDSETQFYVKEGEGGELVSLQVQGDTIGSQDGADDSSSQVVAQLVEAGEPAPGGGPRRVVLLLPDGNLMMTEVDEEQYAALELDKYQSGGDID